MKLVYLNAELDPTKEYELFNVTPQGFKVEIVYTDDNWRTQRGFKTQTFENCTEVHNLFDSCLNEKQIAFESDIKAEGFTRKIDEIESVVISLQPNEITDEEADKNHEKLREILIRYENPEYGDCIVDEISFLFGHPTTNDVHPEED